MSWTNATPVSVIKATKVIHYDKVFDNTLVLMSSLSVEHYQPTGGVTQGGVHKIFGHASCSDGDSPAPTKYGKYEYFFEFKATATFGAAPATATVMTFTIDDQIDYRDRILHINGLVAAFGNATDSDKWVPGGAEDDRIWGSHVIKPSATDGPGTLSVNIADQPGSGVAEGGFNMFRGIQYSESGFDMATSPAGDAALYGYMKPRTFIWTENVGGQSYIAIAVDASTGELKLYAWHPTTFTDAIERIYNVHGRIVAGPDEGHI